MKKVHFYKDPKEGEEEEVITPDTGETGEGGASEELDGEE